MQLVSFSVTNFRSITTAYKLPIRQSTILVGPNNEGKSNVLRALVTALELLRSFSGGRISRNRLRFSLGSTEALYRWEHDFPILLQAKKPDGESIFDLEFKLTDSEVADFNKEVKSSLNGTLPIQLTIGRENPGFSVTKKGPGGPALSKKSALIASFVAKRININYIPAVRTAEAASEVVTAIVERQLASIERESSFIAAMDKVAALQQPILNEISEGIRETLKEFLPNVKNVKVEISSSARYRALRRACEIIVDDGTPTPLSRKGDGVQSLAALSLMRHGTESDALGGQTILAIEEPESHLHPLAIHQLRTVIADIATRHQVIMTTHCPLFVNRTALKSNIIVHNRKASPANDVRQLREVLGVRASDNLQHAELILVVEGEDDRRALKALLAANSPALSAALSNGGLGIESLQGGSNLSYKLSHIREALCLSHSYMDDDDCGRKAIQKAQDDGLLSIADVTMTVCQGMKESEFEDLYEEAIYSEMLKQKYGVSTLSPKFKGTKKWSDRLRDAFHHQGKPWNNRIEAAVKVDIAAIVEANPNAALNPHKRTSFDAVVVALTEKLNVIVAGKK